MCRASPPGRTIAWRWLSLGHRDLADHWRQLTAHVGGQVILSTGVSGTCPLALQWFHDDTAIEGATKPYLWLTNVQLLDAGAYTLICHERGRPDQ